MKYRSWCCFYVRNNFFICNKCVQKWRHFFSCSLAFVEIRSRLWKTNDSNSLVYRSWVYICFILMWFKRQLKLPIPSFGVMLQKWTHFNEILHVSSILSSARFFSLCLLLIVMCNVENSKIRSADCEMNHWHVCARTK